jgi:hypothetical protein
MQLHHHLPARTLKRRFEQPEAFGRYEVIVGE